MWRTPGPGHFLNLTDKTVHQSSLLLSLCGTPRETGKTHLDPPGRFLSKPSRFLSAKDGLEQDRYATGVVRHRGEMGVVIDTAT